jgi:hypothetical protein
MKKSADTRIKVSEPFLNKIKLLDKGNNHFGTVCHIILIVSKHHYLVITILIKN